MRPSPARDVAVTMQREGCQRSSRLGAVVPGNSYRVVEVVEAAVVRAAATRVPVAEATRDRSWSGRDLCNAVKASVSRL